MERATNVFMRNAKGVALLIGLVLAVLTNSDTLYDVKRLSNNESLREAMKGRALSLYSSPSPSANSSSTSNPSLNSFMVDRQQQLENEKEQLDGVLSDLSLPIGWKAQNLTRQLGCKAKIDDNRSEFAKTCLTTQSSAKPQSISQLINFIFQFIIERPLELVSLLIGWILSGIAFSMGAEFWFKLLRKVLDMRNNDTDTSLLADREPFRGESNQRRG